MQITKNKKHTEDVRRKQTNGGFTLIETVIFIILFTITMMALLSSIIYLYRSNRYSIEQSVAVNSARLGIQEAVKQIREATFSDEGAYPIISISPTQMYFYSDIDPDMQIERVRLFLDGTELKKGITDAVGDPPVYDDANEVISTISTDVQNTQEGIALLRYYDSSGAEITDFTKIVDLSFVTIRLVVNVNPSVLPNNFTLYSTAALRNLSSNR